MKCMILFLKKFKVVFLKSKENWFTLPLMVLLHGQKWNNKDKEDYGQYKKKKVWDTNQITPGTKFMNQLSIYLQNRCKEFNVHCVLSDSNEPGEGEHKIMKYMDTLPMNTTNVVYGLDADLIMLSMIENILFIYYEKGQNITLKI